MYYINLIGYEYRPYIIGGTASQMLDIIWAISNGFKSMLHKKINTWSVLFSVETISAFQRFKPENPFGLRSSQQPMICYLSTI